jgi:hypothetical protein
LIELPLYARLCAKPATNVYRFQLLDVQVSRAHRGNELTVVFLEDGGRYRPALLVSYTWVSKRSKGEDHRPQHRCNRETKTNNAGNCIALRIWLATQPKLLPSVEGKLTFFRRHSLQATISPEDLNRHRSVILYVYIELALCVRIERFSIGTKAKHCQTKAIEANYIANM